MNADENIRIRIGSGITLRMYLVAHAPEEPQEWFSPTTVRKNWGDPEYQRQRYLQWPGAWADEQINMMQTQATGQQA